MTVDVETKFVVLTDNRSGSTWVMSTLNSLPHVMAQGELFLRRARSTGRRWDTGFALPRYVQTKPEGLSVRPFSVFSYLRALYERPGPVGFKLMYAQLRSYPELLAYFIRNRIRVVHLVRRNHLDVLISYAVKAKIGQAHLLPGQSVADETKVELDTDHLISRLEWLRRKQTIARKLLNWSGLPHMEIAYEDLLRDQAHFRLVWDFLSIQYEGDMPEPTILKIRKGGHRAVISNYDEVKEVLAGSQFAGLLE